MTLGEALLFVERTLDYAGYKYSDSELRDLFDGRSLSEPATREDVATIIYAVLGNNSPSTTSAAINYVSYEADEDKPITFDEDDFKDVCKNATKETLSYVKFELPTTTYGALYFDYTSSTNYDSKVSSTTKYYYNADTSKDESSLSKVTFVPASNYSGTVKINYTAYTTEGNSYSGIVKLTINEDKLVADDINLGTSSNSAITLDEDDFNGVCKEETKETLSYVKFTLPSTTNGALYYDYTSASDYDSKVSSTSKYYYDSNDGKYLGKVTFVPTANYTGTVQIAYTGYDKDGENFTGTIKIIVK